MAETAVSGLIKVTLERLSSPVTEQLWLFCGLSEDIEKLRKTLDIIMGVVSDAEEKQQKNRAVNSWLKQLKEAAYDAADILDECETEALRRKLETEGGVTEKVREFFSASNPVVFDFLMARKVKEIRERLDAIAGERLKFDLRVGDLRVNETKGRKETVSFIDESRVYGREKDKENVVDLLLNADNDKKVSVIPVLGMGGLGKTTLAQWVYNDARVERHFNLKIWVCVSTDSDVKRLTKAILYATGGKSAHETLDEMQRSLREHLSHKKFLLVLDDVWDDNPDKWEQLKGFLRAGAMGSKIIVTTRSQKVASVMGTLPCHRLTELSFVDCWPIFKQRAFGQGRQENQSLFDLGKKITEKCRGIPLIAKALGSLMYFKTEESQWQSVIDNEIWNVLEEHDRSMHEENDRTLPALRLSYNDLQPPLKRCFAYCSVFPKGHRMYKEELIQMWMAEGFIQPSPGSRQMEEEIGSEYFDELLWRSFFQDAEKDVEGNVSCKMHDLIHDLARSVSEDARSIVTEDGKITIPDGCRHLSVESRDRERDSSVFKRVSITLMPSDSAKKLRTLFLRLPVLHILHEFVTHLPCLRVLDLDQSSEDMLNTASGLKQLRYLCMDVRGVKILSNSLSKLHNLQTLRLINAHDLKELPREMRKMVSLRHLEIPYGGGSLTHMPEKMGELTSLRTLPVFVVGEDSGRNIGQLGNLNYLSGKLNIQNLENVTNKANAQEAKVSEKAYLTSLGLSWSRRIANAAEVLEGLQPHRNLRYLSVENYGGERLPHRMGGCGLPNLVELSLSDWIGWEQLQLPGQFRSLKSLSVWGMDAVKCFGSDFYGNGAFPSLEKVTLGGMANLEKWSACNGGRQGALPSLKRLTVRGCPKLSAVPCFPLLSSLTLSGFEAESLPNCFFQSQLTHLTITRCQNLESLSWEVGNVAATLEYMNIQNCPKLRSLFPEEMQNHSLCLRRLHIYECDGLTSLRLQGLDSLRDLSIDSCKNLASFVGGMHHLTALQHLDITECPELLGSLADGMEHLTSLTSLNIIRWAQATHLPEGLKHATRLRELYIENLPNLSALPDWIGNLSSLQQLLANDCPNLASLPSGFQHLINLRYLQIVDCHPELVKRCEKETGEDWHKISHIPQINIYSDGSERQRHGRLQESNSCWISIRIMWTAILNSFWNLMGARHAEG